MSARNSSLVARRSYEGQPLRLYPAIDSNAPGSILA